MGEGVGRRRKRRERGRVERCVCGYIDERGKMVIEFGEARRSYWYKSITRDRRAREADSEEVLESAVWHWMWSRRGQNTDRMPLRPCISRNNHNLNLAHHLHRGTSKPWAVAGEELPQLKATGTPE